MIGRIVDGTVDYVNGVVIYVGFFVGINRAGFDFFLPNWILVLGAGLCMIFHSVVIDYYRSKFLAHALGKKRSPREDKEMFSKELKKLKKQKGRLVEKFFIHLYLGYSHVQVNKAVKKRIYKKDEYYRTNKRIMQLWSLIGSSTYIFAFMISGILFRPTILFWYAIVAANIFTIILWIVQARKNHRIIRSS